ncbi:MAG: transposase, partial [bacterium]
MLLDGLYLAKSELRGWKSRGVHPVIKTTQTNNRLIDRAQSLFHQTTNPKDHHSIDIASYQDDTQNTTYRLWTIGPMYWDAKAPYLTVGRLEVIHDDGDRDVYWLVTTDHELSADELMELARLRWRIENNVFKRLNERVGSKDSYLKNADAKYTLLQLWMLGWCMVQTFWLACEPA